MGTYQLPKHFFKQNQLNDMSAAVFTHFRITAFSVPEVSQQVDKLLIPTLDKSRQEECEREREAIAALTDAEDIVTYMRKIKEPANSDFLIRKALAYQETVVPLVLKRLIKSGHDIFIENAVTLLALAETKYTEELFEIFPDIRNAYARSEICVVFGVKMKKEYSELLYKEYMKLLMDEDDKDYEQGPLLALNLIYEIEE